MKALVTGGNGFIGSHLVDRLAREKWEVDILDPDQRRYSNIPAGARFIQKKLEECNPIDEYLANIDVVFHLAWTTIIESANRNPISDIQTNLIPFLQLLNACRQAGVRKIVLLSSGGTIYGPATTLPISETHELNPITAYGVSKMAAEKYLQMYGKLYNIDYTILRPSSAYGPRQNPRGKQGAVNVFLYRVAHNLPVIIWGDGHIVRDYVYISDLIDALVASVNRNSNNYQVFNISGAENISLIKLINMIEYTVKKPSIIEYYPSRNFDAPEVRLDTDLANHELGWYPKVLLSEGISQTWAWMSSLEI